MRMMFISLCLLLILGCSQVSSSKKFVTVDVINVSSKPLDWVKLLADDRQLLSEGILIPNANRISLDYVWSNIPDQARLTFVDEQTRQRYDINLSLKEANLRVKSGECKRVTIRILAYDKAEVVCQ